MQFLSLLTNVKNNMQICFTPLIGTSAMCVLTVYCKGAPNLGCLVARGTKISI